MDETENKLAELANHIILTVQQRQVYCICFPCRRIRNPEHWERIVQDVVNHGGITAVKESSNGSYKFTLNK